MGALWAGTLEEVSGIMNYDRGDLRDRLASEYVLGTLHGRARKRFQRLMRTDQRLRATVEIWEQSLIPMARSLSVPAPSPDEWKAIAARVAPRSARRAARPTFFERWCSVRNLGSFAAGLVIGLGAILIVPQLQDASGHGSQADAQLPHSYVGFLQDEKENPTVLVSSLRHGKIADIKLLRQVAMAPDQSLQLWALQPNAPALPLGTIPPEGKARLTLAATSEQLLSKVTELAVSLEPKSNPHPAKPSGPFLMRGPCVKLW